jgi:hypothetical protein
MEREDKPERPEGAGTLSPLLEGGSVVSQVARVITDMLPGQKEGRNARELLVESWDGVRSGRTES